MSRTGEEREERREKRGERGGFIHD